MSANVVKESGKYVYCIIRSPGARKSFGGIGYGGGEVYTMEYRDLAPVVSDTPLRKYDVREVDVDLHKNVVQRVMDEHGVVPVAYGMAFKSKKLLIIAMSAGYTAMKKAIKEVDGRVELGVKVLVEPDFDRDKTDDIKRSFMDTLKAKASQSKELKLFSDRLLMNASFLVERDRIDDFSGEVERLQDGDPEVKTMYSGPWPPYNFVDIHILSKRRGGFR
jgi:hypothetical protein